MRKKIFVLLLIGLALFTFISCKENNNPVDEPNNEQIHQHDLTHYESLLPTCVKEGNIEYYHCSSCDEYFKDQDAKELITKDETIIPIDSENESIHIDSNNDLYCDYGCGKALFSNEDLNKVINNTFVLKDVKVEILDIPAAINNIFYVEENLIYQKIDDQELYIYEDQGYKRAYSNANWETLDSTLNVTYTLEYFFKNQETNYDFTIKNSFEVTTCVYGFFEGKTGIEFINKDNVKLIIFINNDLNVLNGFLVKDEYNNIIIQYVINVQKDETYKTNILNIINDLNNE